MKRGPSILRMILSLLKIELLSMLPRGKSLIRITVSVSMKWWVNWAREGSARYFWPSISTVDKNAQ